MVRSKYRVQSRLVWYGRVTRITRDYCSYRGEGFDLVRVDHSNFLLLLTLSGRSIAMDLWTLSTPRVQYRRVRDRSVA